MATSQSNIDPNYLLSALEWHVDNGVNELLSDEPIDRTKAPEPKAPASTAQSILPNTANKSKPSISIKDAIQQQTAAPIMGATQAIIDAKALAEKATTLDELKSAIAGFEGISICANATNMVFADGNPKAEIMVIGDTPYDDDDATGIAFQGAIGQLQDKIFASINLSRVSDDVTKAIYLTNLLNWRPPGNRAPNQAETDISLPFLKRHIELVKPKVIICSGGLPAQALLGTKDTISKLRGKFHDYEGTPLLVTYHPNYLLNTPAQKRATWMDILMLKAHLSDQA